MSDELANLDAIGQAELVRRGEMQPIELVDAAIARIENTNPRLNAVITPLFDKAREEARSPRLAQGPFRGVPYLLKDLDVYRPAIRSRRNALSARSPLASRRSYLVAKLRRAGFIFLGRRHARVGLNVRPSRGVGRCPTREPDHSWAARAAAGGRGRRRMVLRRAAATGWPPRSRLRQRAVGRPEAFARGASRWARSRGTGTASVSHAGPARARLAAILRRTSLRCGRSLQAPAPRSLLAEIGSSRFAALGFVAHFRA